MLEHYEGGKIFDATPTSGQSAPLYVLVCVWISSVEETGNESPSKLRRLVKLEYCFVLNFW